ncbi:MAG: hypothetical protein Q4D98_10945 [Planctomycetia bacterium]|nr:hypothetical protein [Planctomycetia bacterium]
MNKFAVVTLLALLVPTASMWADDVWVTDASGDINAGTNWVSGTAPFSGNAASDKGLLTQTSGTATSTSGLYLSGNTQYNQTGGSFNVTGGSLVVGRSSDYTNVSKLTIHGGTFTLQSQVDIGASGKGEVVFNGGDLTANYYFALGNQNAQAWGKFTQNGGTVVSTAGTGWITIGHSGTGIYVMNAGSATAGKIDLGTENGTNSNGSLYVYGGTMKSNNSLQIGVSGTGLVEVSSETVPTATMLDIAGNTSVGKGSSSIGTLNLKNHGTMRTSSLEIGNSGTGTLSIADNATLTVTKAILSATNTGSIGNVTQTGGTLSTTSNTVVGFAGTSQWTMKGGTLTTQTLYVGNAGDGTFNYEGGTLDITQLSIGNAVKSDFNNTTYSTGSGTMNIQNDANLTLSIPVSVGTVTGTTGTLNLKNGSLTTSKTLYVGTNSGAGSGTLNLTSGTLTSLSIVVSLTGNIFQSGGVVETSYLNLDHGKYTMTDGTLGSTSTSMSINGAFVIHKGTIQSSTFNVGNSGGSGSFTQYGGTVETSSYFCLANNDSGSVGHL